MKMQLTGYNHKEKTHDIPVVPHFANIDGLLIWDGPLQATGRINDLTLRGDYRVKFTFEEGELRNWLLEFVEAKPEAAIKLMAEMQAEAILALNQKPGEKK